MVIEIKDDLFSSNDFKGLNYLIQILTYKQRYALFVEHTRLENSVLYKRLDEDDKLELMENYNRVITESLYITHTIGLDSKNDQFCLEEAISFFIQPFSIILENGLNDKYLIEAIIEYFDSDKEIKRHLENGWIQFENGGGCTNIKNFIEGKLQSFNNLAKKYEKPNDSYLKYFVFVDSDREFPTQANKHKKLVTETGDNKIHVFKKREMENYMPDEALDVIAGDNSQLKKWVDAFKNLSPIQKDFLDIEKGFPKQKLVKNNKNSRRKQKKRKRHEHEKRTNRQELDSNIKLLYHDVSDANFKILDEGFKLKDFKTEFPKKFELKEAHKKNLLIRAGSNEFEDIITKINKLL